MKLKAKEIGIPKFEFDWRIGSLFNDAVLKFVLISSLIAVIFFAGFWLGRVSVRSKAETKSISFFEKLIGTQIKKPSLKEYSIENLRGRNYPGSKIELGEVIEQDKTYASYLFTYFSEGKKITGQLNAPKNVELMGLDLSASSRSNPFGERRPVIVMLRGYVDRQKYQTGDGTRRAAAYFASRGFVTLAPDFLGYGQSDTADPDPLKARFETYVATLNLLNSINSLPFAVNNNLFLWGHSNGGQIALTVLEITPRPIPTVLWAPVSKPFPYSVLFYSDEASDSGKLLRRKIAEFEKDHDADDYSLTNYLGSILSPLQIHQGSADDIVLPRWSQELVEKLKDLNGEVSYFEYAGDDHNFAKGNWGRAAARDLDFYRRFLR